MLRFYNVVLSKCSRVLFVEFVCFWFHVAEFGGIKETDSIHYHHYGLWTDLWLPCCFLCVCCPRAGPSIAKYWEVGTRRSVKTFEKIKRKEWFYHMSWNVSIVISKMVYLFAVPQGRNTKSIPKLLVSRAEYNSFRVLIFLPSNIERWWAVLASTVQISPKRPAKHFHEYCNKARIDYGFDLKCRRAQQWYKHFQ